MNKMSRLWLGLALLPLMAGSCEVFTASWASWAARDLDTVEITVDNIDDLIDEVAGDPQRSLELLRKLEGTIQKQSGTAKAKLQAAALDVAINASGLVSAALDGVSELLSALDTSKDASGGESLGDAGKQLLGILNKLENVQAISRSLNTILDNGNDIPTGAGATPLMMTGLILAYNDVSANTAAPVTQSSFETYLKTCGDPTQPSWKKDHPSLATAQKVFTNVGAGDSTFSGTATNINDMLERTGN